MAENNYTYVLPSLGADMDEGTLNEWMVQPGDTVNRGQIVAVVHSGTAPAQAAPELIGLKTTQVKFSNLSKPRVHPHYVVKREECNHRGVEQNCYYLPIASSVQSVRGGL